MFEVQEHDHEQVKHEDGSGIDDNLHGGEKFGMECDEQCRDMKEHDQQGNDAVDGIAKCNYQNRGERDDRREEKEGEDLHVSDGPTGSPKVDP